MAAGSEETAYAKLGILDPKGKFVAFAFNEIASCFVLTLEDTTIRWGGGDIYLRRSDTTTYERVTAPEGCTFKPRVVSAPAAAALYAVVVNVPRTVSHLCVVSLPDGACRLVEPLGVEPERRMAVTEILGSSAIDGEVLVRGSISPRRPKESFVFEHCVYRMSTRDGSFVEVGRLVTPFG
jgi:hypothetical protein